MAGDTYTSLSSSYGQFRVPAAAVTLGGDDVVEDLGCRIQKIEAVLSRGEPCKVDIELWDCYDMAAHSLKAGFKSASELGSLLTVDLGYMSSLAKVFSGYLEGVTLELNAGEAYVVHLEGWDALKLMKENTRCRMFQGTSHSDAVSEILGEYSWVCSSDCGSTTSLEEEETWWQRGSDYEFIAHEMAGRHNPGFEFYVELGTAYFAEKSDHEVAVTLKPGEGIEELHINWKYLNKKIQVQGISQSHQCFLGECTVTGSHILSSAGEGEEYHCIPQADTGDKATGLADALGEKQKEAALEFSLTTPGLPQLIPGRAVALEGLDAWVNGTYVITEAVHTLDEDGYRTTIKLRE